MHNGDDDVCVNDDGWFFLFHLSMPFAPVAQGTYAVANWLAAPVEYISNTTAMGILCVSLFLRNGDKRHRFDSRVRMYVHTQSMTIIYSASTHTQSKRDEPAKAKDNNGFNVKNIFSRKLQSLISWILMLFTFRVLQCAGPLASRDTAAYASTEKLKQTLCSHRLWPNIICRNWNKWQMAFKREQNSRAQRKHSRDARPYPLNFLHYSDFLFCLFIYARKIRPGRCWCLRPNARAKNNGTVPEQKLCLF